MDYTVDEIRQFTAEEDVKFLRLAFCDIFGSQKNISILPDELDRAFSYGIAFDASAVPGFGDEVLRQLARRLESAFSGDDVMVARTGGEEFGLRGVVGQGDVE